MILFGYARIILTVLTNLVIKTFIKELIACHVVNFQSTPPCNCPLLRLVCVTRKSQTAVIPSVVCTAIAVWLARGRAAESPSLLPCANLRLSLTFVRVFQSIFTADLFH